MIVGFDLGQRCGYGLLDNDGQRIKSGTVNLGPRSGNSLSKFRSLIEDLLSEGVTSVSYERVRRHRGVEAAHAYGGYLAVLWLTCHDAGIPISNIINVTVQQIKKCATGQGNAEKDDVGGQAMVRWCHIPEDDNEADALFCAEVARQLLNGNVV